MPAFGTGPSAGPSTPSFPRLSVTWASWLGVFWAANFPPKETLETATVIFSTLFPESWGEAGAWATSS